MRRVTRTMGRDLEGDGGGCIAYTLNNAVDCITVIGWLKKYCSGFKDLDD